MPPTYTHDVARQRFLAELEAGRASLSYRMVGDGIVDFESTFVPESLRHRSVGSGLVEHALDWARERGLRVIPSCWFVRVVAARSETYRSLLV